MEVLQDESITAAVQCFFLGPAAWWEILIVCLHFVLHKIFSPLLNTSSKLFSFSIALKNVY